MRNSAGLKLLALYFVIGGLIIATVTCFGIQGKSEFAVLIAFLPGTTLITLITIYLAGGVGAAGSYAKSMLILLPVWVLYVVVVIFLLPRSGLALLVSVAPYLGAASLTMKPTEPATRRTESSGHYTNRTRYKRPLPPQGMQPFWLPRVLES